MECAAGRLRFEHRLETVHGLREMERHTRRDTAMGKIGRGGIVADT